MSDQMRQSICAVLGVFEKPEALLEAARKVQAENARKKLGELDAHSPYPVHGLAKALALPASPLGWLVLGGGLVGVLAGLGLQSWISAVNYPIEYAGKPLFSWPSFVPIMFELMVLFSAFAAFLGMLGVLNKLPFFGNPLLGTKQIAAATRDRFVLVIKAPSDKPESWNAETAFALLQSVGASEVEPVYLNLPEPVPHHDNIPFETFATFASISLVALGAGWTMYWVIKVWPDIAPNIYMAVQPKLNPQSSSDFFADQKGMRSPPQGTVARSFPHYPLQIGPDELVAAALLSNPLPLNEEALRAGRKHFETYCMACHGQAGDGKKSLSDKYTAVPANLQSQRIREMPDGQIFHTMTVGKGLMPGHQTLISPEKRWQIMHYLRALQRAQNASPSDLGEAAKYYTLVSTDPAAAGAANPKTSKEQP